jgi:hypothetical protein
MQELDSSRPKPGRMEETLEGGRGPPRAVVPLERERERERDVSANIYSHLQEAPLRTKDIHSSGRNM